MTIGVDAVYEDGVLKLEHPVDLKDKTRVHVTIDSADEPAASDELSGWEAIDALKGIVKGAPADVSENHDGYLYGKPSR